MNSMNIKNKLSFKKITDIFAKKTGLSGKVLIIVIIGILGLLMIALSEFFPSGKVEKGKDVANTMDNTSYSEGFKQRTEKELREIIGKIDGVGEVSLMITLDGTTEYVYAEDVDTETDEENDSKSNKYKNEVIIVDSDGGEKALIKKIVEPKVKGVVIVCSGGGKTEIKERVTKAVSSALNISTNNICVEKG